MGTRQFFTIFILYTMNYDDSDKVPPTPTNTERNEYSESTEPLDQKSVFTDKGDDIEQIFPPIGEIAPQKNLAASKVSFRAEPKKFEEPDKEICDEVLKSISKQLAEKKLKSKSKILDLEVTEGKLFKSSKANVADKIDCECTVCPLDKSDKSGKSDKFDKSGIETHHKRSTKHRGHYKSHYEELISQYEDIEGELSDENFGFYRTQKYDDYDGGEEYYGLGPGGDTTYKTYKSPKLEQSWYSFRKEYSEGSVVYKEKKLRTPKFSPKSEHEGDLFEDYMTLFIEPFDKASYVSLSSVSSSYISCVEPNLQRTIVIIKPEAMPYRQTILRVITENAFQITGLRCVHLTAEQASEIYANHYGTPSFPHLIISTCARPVLVLAIAAYDAVNKWKAIIGPDSSLREEWFYPISMRKMFGLHNKRQPDLVHGSDNFKIGEKENRYFFPNSILEPLICESDDVWDYCNMFLNKSIVDGCTEVCKKKPDDPILFLADWLLTHNPFQPRMPHWIALSPL